MYKDIPLKSLVPSKLNYRTACNAASLKELTASVKAMGILEPLIVRPLNGKAKGKFEIVAGHRRHQAAIGAGLKEISCMVNELTDEQAVEVQIIENVQREDPNPMDEAHGFKRLMDMGAHTPETLAEKINRSVAYVLGRVKLAGLDAAVQKKIASGELGPGHAVLFTRLRDAADQKEFLKQITQRDMSVGEACRSLAQYCLKLKDAPFNTSECAACPSRSRNQAVLFPELKKTDECADRTCYASKTEAHYLAILAEKEAQGFKIFRDAKKVEALLHKTASRIVSSKKEADCNNIYPRDYSTACASMSLTSSPCKENHAYYLVEKKDWQGVHIEFGELCLDKKCLKKMNRVERGEKEPGRVSSKQDDEMDAQRRRERAAKCRDRFLLSALAPKVETSDVLRKRLCLSAMIQAEYNCRKPVLDVLTATPGSGVDHQVSRPYKLAAAIPSADLDKAMLAAVLMLLTYSNGQDVLLNMAQEAGLNIDEEFAVDREWLESQSFKDKGNLVKLIEELKEKGDLGIDVKQSKAALIDAVLAYDLKGLVPDEIKATFAALDADIETDGECQNCGMTTCDGSCEESGEED